jgi:hypothetical protein
MGLRCFAATEQEILWLNAAIPQWSSVMEVAQVKSWR